MLIHFWRKLRLDYAILRYFSWIYVLRNFFVSRQRTKSLSISLFPNIAEKTSTPPESRVRRRNP